MCTNRKKKHKYKRPFYLYWGSWTTWASSPMNKSFPPCHFPIHHSHRFRHATNTRHSMALRTNKEALFPPPRPQTTTHSCSLKGNMYNVDFLAAFRQTAKQFRVASSIIFSGVSPNFPYSLIDRLSFSGNETSAPRPKMHTVFRRRCLNESERLMSSPQFLQDK